MAGLLERLFKVIQATLHSIVSRFEDPIKLAEQGIRDLKVDFDNSLKGLAEVKAIAISTKRELEEKKLSSLKIKLLNSKNRLKTGKASSKLSKPVTQWLFLLRKSTSSLCL